MEVHITCGIKQPEEATIELTVPAPGCCADGDLSRCRFHCLPRRGRQQRRHTAVFRWLGMGPWVRDIIVFFEMALLLRWSKQSITWTGRFSQPTSYGVQGPRSEALVTKTRNPTAPGAPRALRCVSTTANAIDLEWLPPEETGGAPVTAFTVVRDDGQVQIVVWDESEVKVSRKDVRVTVGGRYRYSVFACNLPPSGDSRNEVLASVSRAKASRLQAVPPEHKQGTAAGPVEAVAHDQLATASCACDLRSHMERDGVTLFYKTSCRSPHIHCRTDERWSNLPGLPLTRSSVGSFASSEGWFSIYLPAARSLEFVMNDEDKQFDKAPGGQNYRVAAPGCLLWASGILERVEAPPQAPQELSVSVEGLRVTLSWIPEEGRGGSDRVQGPSEWPRRCPDGCCFVDKNLFAFTDYEYKVAAVNNQEVCGALASAWAQTRHAGVSASPRPRRSGGGLEMGPT